MIKSTQYFITVLRILLSLPTLAVAAVPIAILCGEIIFPIVAPTVFAPASQDGSSPRLPAVSTCKPPNSTFAEVPLHVTNVPIAPTNGAAAG